MTRRVTPDPRVPAAAQTPNPSAITKMSRLATSASSIEAGAKVLMSERTRSWVRRDVPMSPFAIRCRKRQYWTVIGLS